MKPTEKFEDALEDLVRMSHELGELLGRIHAGRDGAPSAQRYDTPRTSGHASVKFCEHHEQDNCPCGEATVYPAVSDPTGEAAVKLAQHRDQARRDLDAFHDAIRAVRRGRDVLYRLHGAWMPHDPNVIEKGLSNPPGCKSCARLGRWSEVWRDFLCRWCYGWRSRVGGLPPVDKLSDHHAGKRVTIPASKAS